MPLSIKEFNEKGIAPTRTGGFSGLITSSTMTLLRSEKLAFSLTEVAKATGSDMDNDEQNKVLMNVLYNLRVAKAVRNKKKGTVRFRDSEITMKEFEGERYYRIATEDEKAEQLEIAKEKIKTKDAPVEAGDTSDEDVEEEELDEDDEEK